MRPNSDYASEGSLPKQSIEGIKAPPAAARAGHAGPPTDPLPPARAGRRPACPERLSRAAPASTTSATRIVLLAADGLPNAEIARRTGTSRPTVVGWRDRYST